MSFPAVSRTLFSLLMAAALAVPGYAEAARQKAEPAKTAKAAKSPKSTRTAAPAPSKKKAATAAKPVRTPVGASAKVKGSSKVASRAKPIVYVPAEPTVGQASGLHQALDPLALNTGSAIVLDADTQEIVYEKNAKAILPIASITKLMTALVVLDSGASWDDVLTVTNDDIDTEKGSSSRLRIGAKLTRGEMLNLALMSSENRAASALARHHPGGTKAFVEAMNARAVKLGMTQTRYVDSTGLSNANRSSATDLAKLVQLTSSYEPIRRWSTTPEGEVEVSGRRLQYRNSNELVRSGAWDIIVQKTGYIREAGRCVVMEVEASGRRLVMVLLDSVSAKSRWADARKLRTFVESRPSPAQDRLAPHPKHSDHVIPTAAVSPGIQTSAY